MLLRVLIAVTAVVFAACGSRPVPLTAQAGTTFVLMIPNDFEAGFGTAWASVGGGLGPFLSQTDPSLEDLQRGELFLFAIDPTLPSVEYHLPIRFITRVGPGPGSPASTARRRAVADPGYVLDPDADHGMWPGQVIAFVDIPETVPAAPGVGTLYEIFPERRIRRQDIPDIWYEPDPRPTIYLSGEGWDNEAPLTSAPIRLTILPSNGQQHSPLTGSTHANLWNQADRLLTTIPDPALEIRVFTAGSIVFYPAAGEVEVSYPSRNVAVTGVSLGKNDPSSAIVRWELLPEGPDTGCTTSRTVRIQFMDPDQLTGALGLAFENPDPTSACARRLDPDDFTLANWKLYNLNGDAVTDPIFKPQFIAIR